MSDINENRVPERKTIQAVALVVIAALLIIGLVTGFLAFFTDRLSAVVYLPLTAICLMAIALLSGSKRIWDTDSDGPTERDQAR